MWVQPTEFVVHVVIRQQVVGLLLDGLEEGALPAGTAQHEMVINVGIRKKVRGVEVLRQGRTT
jgi:hypothetical protein